MDDKHNEQLDSTLEQGKNELDKAVVNATETGRNEALALGYVELIEIMLNVRGVDFRVDPESYQNIYEAYRTKGEDIPDPASKVFFACNISASFVLRSHTGVPRGMKIAFKSGASDGHKALPHKRTARHCRMGGIYPRPLLNAI